MYFELYRNGIRVGRINPKSFNSNAIKAGMVRGAEQELSIIAKEAASQMDSFADTRIRRRVLVDENATHLADAYKQAASKSSVTVEGGEVILSLLDVKLLDRLLPMEGEHSGKGGWWRIYEHGSPGSRVGGSTRFGFVPAEGEGKHGQGIMVDLAKAKNAGSLRPHPGVMPLRITHRFKSMVRDIMKERRERLMDSIARTAIGAL